VTVLSGRYELGEEIGAGGMGRVVEAHDQVLGRDVAIKLLNPAAEQIARERFIREARSAARLHHPNVVTVFDTGEEDGQPYLVMELVRGHSLQDLLDDRGQLEVDEAVGITIGVLEGLAAAHRSGMVHRDVKPANVLLPDEGGVKLSDFGIAKALDEAGAELTAAGSLMGTPTYLAPELVGGQPPSPSSDVYSVGCLLYAQLTGRPPFHEGEPIAVAYAHRNESVPPIEDARPDLPPELVTVVARALEKDPEQRYDSAVAMRTALLDGPEAVPLTGAQTVAMAGVPADRTQVMSGSDDQATRAIGATAAAPAAAPAPAPAPARRRRWWIPVLVVVALLALALILWPLLSGAPGDGDLLEDEPDETEVEEEPEETEEPEEPAPPPSDEGPEEPPAEPEEPTPPPEEPDEEEPAEEPEEDEPPIDVEDPLEDEEDDSAAGDEDETDDESATDAGAETEDDPEEG
jgi:eukaryotic-like serine/threonine-protein kinase